VACSDQCAFLCAFVLTLEDARTNTQDQLEKVLKIFRLRLHSATAAAPAKISAKVSLCLSLPLHISVCVCLCLCLSVSLSWSLCLSVSCRTVSLSRCLGVSVSLSLRLSLSGVSGPERWIQPNVPPVLSPVWRGIRQGLSVHLRLRPPCAVVELTRACGAVAYGCSLPAAPARDVHRPRHTHRNQTRQLHEGA
jgi:hypothetical protein